MGRKKFLIHMAGFVIITAGLFAGDVSVFSASYWLVMVGVIIVYLNA